VISPAATTGLAVTAFTVFALGLRHGADPEHPAAIDNLTRNLLTARSRLSRCVGTLSTGRHLVLVLSSAALQGLLWGRLAVNGSLFGSLCTFV